MRLDFNVLWVEDQQSAVDSQRERIELLIKKEGFRLQVKFARSVDQAKGLLSEDIYGDHVDLVLMDYDLGEGAYGDEGLVEVRNIFPYKDIVFYSSRASDLLDMVANKQLQGIYCSARDDLPNTVDGLFENLVKKVLDIDHSRGIVMGATSDIDYYVNDCLRYSFESCDESDRRKALETIAEHVCEKKISFDKNLKTLSAIAHVSDLETLHHIYTSNDRLRLLKKMFENDGTREECTKNIVKYLQDIVPKRNDLAHVRVQVDGFSRKLFNRQSEELTSEQMKSLRKELLEYQDFFEDLSASLNHS